MKWTGGSKEALKNRKRIQGSNRFAGPRKRIDDVFFARGDEDANEGLQRPVTSRRVRTSLASISQWSQAAGLIVPSVDHPVRKAIEEENVPLPNAEPNMNVPALRRTSNVSLPKTALSELISPEKLLQLPKFQPKQSAIHAVDRLFTKKNFEAGVNETQVNLNQSEKSELVLGRIIEPLSMQPSCIVQSPTSFASSKVAKDQTRFHYEESSSSSKTASKRRILDEDVRVEFSPGKDPFFAYSRPERVKGGEASTSM